tara:strand:- start:352 stop:807 length:456 start_codon:yes stop_codon:yes gene_type:complete
MNLIPVTIRTAKAFVTEVHRHHKAPQGALFAVGVSEGDDLVGVAIIGRPVARALQDGFTAEVTRVAVLEGQKNACSMLYGAARRACKALGYKTILTYTLQSEPGTSLKAAGWTPVAEVRGRNWSDASVARQRSFDDQYPDKINKVRWEAAA